MICSCWSYHGLCSDLTTWTMDFLFQGLLRVRGRPAVAYDQQGLVFAVAMEGGAIKLFDVRSYDKVSEPVTPYYTGPIALVFTSVCGLEQKHT